MHTAGTLSSMHACMCAPASSVQDKTGSILDKDDWDMEKITSPDSAEMPIVQNLVGW